MLGYQIYDKSINGVKTLSDGVITIQNGNILNANNITGDNITAGTITGDNIIEIENDINNNTELINEINTVKIPNLQTQITSNTTNINTINNTSIPNLQSQITSNTNNINTINNTSIPNLQTQITNTNNNLSNNYYNKTSVDGFVNGLDARLDIIEPSYLKTANVGTTTTLNSNQNATVSITKTGNNATFNFGIPRGKGLTYKGVYNVSEEYYTNDIVKYNNDFYICIQDVLFVGSGTPNVSDDWSLMLDDATLKGQGFTWRGNWSDEKTFNKYDIALYFGSCYICNSNTPLISNDNPEDDNTNWSLFVSRGEKGDKGDKGDNGSDSDFASVLGILGGVGVIFGAVALTGLAFANQFQNMKNKLGNISDELQNVGEEGNTDYRLGRLEAKTRLQETDNDNSLSNTYFTSDVIIRSAPFQNNIILNRTGEIQAVSINTTNSTATNTTTNNLTVNNNATITNGLTCNGAINFDGSSIYIGNTNPFETISTVNLTGIVKVNGFPIEFANGFFQQW